MELIDSDTLSSSLPQGGLQRETLLGLVDLGKSTGGVIPSTGLEVAIKRVAQDSSQGMKEFVAEITSMGLLRH